MPAESLNIQTKQFLNNFLFWQTQLKQSNNCLAFGFCAQQGQKKNAVCLFGRLKKQKAVNKYTSFDHHHTNISRFGLTFEQRKE